MGDNDVIQITNPDNKTLVISNIDKYNIEFIKGKLIITPKKSYLTDKDIIH